MAGIFISYRRDDSPGHAGRIFDRLCARFGEAAIFMDVDAIEAGTDFARAIERAVGTSDVLLAIIGPGWASAADAAGGRRLHDPQDFVRLEIVHALRRHIRVLPVLVENARLPDADELPAELSPLLGRQALELRDDRWDADIGDLIRLLEPTARGRTASARRAMVLAGTIGVLVVVGAALIALRGGAGTPNDPPPAARIPAAAPRDPAVAPPSVAAAPPPAAAEKPDRLAPASPTPAVSPAPSRSGLGLLWFGLRSDTFTKAPPGVRVSYVYSGGPAANAGIASGDILVEVAGRPVTRFSEMADAVSAAVNSAPGTPSEVALVRGGRLMRVSVVFDREFRPQP